MTKSFEYNAKAPTGEIVSRKSPRTYTHVVFARNDYAAALEQAKADSPTSFSNGEYNLRLAASSVGDKHPCGVGQVRAGEPEGALQSLAGAKTADEYAAIMRSRRIDDVEKAKAAGYYDKCSVIGWCGRLDLAQKLAKPGMTIVPVGVKPTTSAPTCTYPACKCIVSTSTSQPTPVCPKGGTPL